MYELFTDKKLEIIRNHCKYWRPNNIPMQFSCQYKISHEDGFSNTWPR